MAACGLAAIRTLLDTRGVIDGWIGVCLASRCDLSSREEDQEGRSACSLWIYPFNNFSLTLHRWRWREGWRGGGGGGAGGGTWITYGWLAVCGLTLSEGGLDGKLRIRLVDCHSNAPYTQGINRRMDSTGGKDRDTGGYVDVRLQPATMEGRWDCPWHYKHFVLTEIDEGWTG